MNSNKIRKITIIVSIILHLLFLLYYENLSSLLLFTPNLFSDVPDEVEKLIEFEFEEPPELVETPDDAIQEPPIEKTNLLSDKNSRARDEYTDNDKQVGMPFQQGDFDVKNLNEMMPQQQADNQAQKQEEQYNKKNNETVKQYSRQPKFSRQELFGKSAPNQQTINRPKYDNDEFSAEEVGGLAFNTYDWDFAPYMLGMKRRIEKNVFPPPAFTHMGLISGETVVRFKVMPNGDLKDLKVLNYKGHKSLMETSLKAIKNSAAFAPLPPDFPENFLEVTASFSYFIKR